MSSSDITVLKQAKTVFSLRSMRTGESYAVTGEMSIGRETDCDIRLNSPLISRYHAKITPTTDSLILEDLNSSNGTFVNGEKVSGSATVSAGDKVSFDSISFRITSPNANKNAPKSIAPSPSVSSSIDTAIVDNSLPDEQTRSRTLDELAGMDDNALLSEKKHRLDEYNTNDKDGEPDIDSLVQIVKQNLASELAEQEAYLDDILDGSSADSKAAGPDKSLETKPLPPSSKTLEDADPFEPAPKPKATERELNAASKASLKEKAQERDQAFELALEPIPSDKKPPESNEALAPEGTEDSEPEELPTSEELLNSADVPTPEDVSNPEDPSTTENPGASEVPAEPGNKSDYTAFHELDSTWLEESTVIKTNDALDNDDKTVIQRPVKTELKSNTSPLGKTETKSRPEETKQAPIQTPIEEVSAPSQDDEAKSPLHKHAVESPDFVDPKTRVRVRLKEKANKTAPATQEKYEPKQTSVPPSFAPQSFEPQSPRSEQENPNLSQVDRKTDSQKKASFDTEGPTRELSNKAFSEQYPFSEENSTEELISSNDYHERVANLKFDWQAPGEKVPEEAQQKENASEMLGKLHFSLSEQDESTDDNDIWITHSSESEESRNQFLSSTRTQSPQLVMMSAPTRGKIFSLDDEKSDWIIGRAAESDIYIPDPEIAFQHAKVELTSEGFVIETCQMTNGMLINNRFTNRAVLANGDVLQFGKIEIVFQSPDEESDDTPEDIIPTEQAVLSRTFDYGAYAGAIVILGAILFSMLTTGSP